MGMQGREKQENGEEEAPKPHIHHPINSHSLPASPVFSWGLYLRSSSSDPAAASETAPEKSKCI